jgi:hypothetical protein
VTTTTKTTATKATANKSTAKKATATKATAKKSTAKKATAKKSTAKKSTVKKATAKKSTAKKATPKKATAKKPTPKISPLRGTPIADFVRDRVTGWQAEAVMALCALVMRAAPKATQAIKWSQPVFELGGPFAFIRPAAKHVTLGLWRGGEMKDPRGVLEGDGDRMKHIKLRSATLDEPLLAGFIRQAIALNAAKGDPTKR